MALPTDFDINNECDGSGPHSGNETRLLPCGGGANLILCRACFTRERVFRQIRNLQVAEPFDLPLWFDLAVYKSSTPSS